MFTVLIVDYIQIMWSNSQVVWLKIKKINNKKKDEDAQSSLPRCDTFTVSISFEIFSSSFFLSLCNFYVPDPLLSNIEHQLNGQ